MDYHFHTCKECGETGYGQSTGKPVLMSLGGIMSQGNWTFTIWGTLLLIFAIAWLKYNC